MHEHRVHTAEDCMSTGCKSVLEHKKTALCIYSGNVHDKEVHVHGSGALSSLALDSST